MCISDKTKKCSKCKVEKPLTDFYIDNSNRSGRQCSCIVCYTDWKRAKSLKAGKTKRRYTLDARKDREKGMKYCPGCEKTRPLIEFYTAGDSNSGVASHCKECSKELQKKVNPTRRHKYYKKGWRVQKNRCLVQKYGITLVEYEELLTEQKGGCKICGLTPVDNNKSLAVDHDHKTGKIRGLLCNNCNVAVGFLKDNPELGIKITSYLKEV